MPPKDNGDPLTEKEINVLRSWIEKGAAWPDNLANEESLTKKHWAFVPPVKSNVPQTGNSWVQSEIDEFVLTKLEDNGLEPNAEADRERLLKRVYLDLLGLPPTVQQQEAFIKDNSDNAYEKVVDDLLTNKHYGEKMAIQ